MTNNTEPSTTEYVTIRQAANTAMLAGQYWELHPVFDITGHEYNDDGTIAADVELTDHAAITDLESITDGSYRLWGNQWGDSFNIEANIDGDTLVRLVDER